MKTALITGITGQDGAYLAELLLQKGYEVHGVKRRSSSFNTGRIDTLFHDEKYKDSFKLHYGDLSDATSLVRLIQQTQPDEIYNLGAMSHVRVSFDHPEYTADVNATGTVRLLEAIRICGLVEKTKYYQASTSELYGLVQEVPQSEKTPFYPRSPYAVAKLYAYWITINYREAYGLFACNGILFNHESPLRGETFATRKIAMAVAAIKMGKQETLFLGNLEAQRDWGFAGDYVQGMWLMLQREVPEDFVLATGETHTVREFVTDAFADAGIKIEWKGKKGSLEEYAIDSQTGKVVVRIDPRYFRPTEVDLLIGNPTKAKEKLGWKPQVSYRELVKMMVDAELKKMGPF